MIQVISQAQIELVEKNMSECIGYGEENYSNVQHLDSGLISLDFVLLGNCGMSDSLNYVFSDDTLKLDYGYLKIVTDTVIEHDSIRYYHVGDNESEIEWFMLEEIEDIHFKRTILDIDTIIHSDTLVLREITSIIERDSYVWCDCCFCFNMVFSGLDMTNVVVMGNKREIPYFPEGRRIFEEQFNLSFGDTINFKDRYGLKQGLWVEFNEFGLEKYLELYQDSKVIKSILFRYRLDGTLEEEVHLQRGFYITQRIKFDSEEKEISRALFDGTQFYNRKKNSP